MIREKEEEAARSAPQRPEASRQEERGREKEEREGGKNKSYKVRYVVVVPGELHYYEKESSPEANGVLPLAGSTCVFEGSAKNGKRTYYTFTLNIVDAAAKKKKKDNHGGVYRFLADDKGLAESWVTALNKSRK